MRNFLLFLLFLVCIVAYSQSNFKKLDEKDDIKVGLVLSGGGAKGLAHIGVLKVLEEAGIRVDYIGGTSMGAIIGAMYSAGYSAQQLDSIFDQLNFDKIIQDKIPRRARNLHKKRSTDSYALTLPFDNFKIGLPIAYSQGRNLFNEYAKLLYPVNNISDFSQLSIPFLCAITDVENGEMKIVEEGYLPQAISASGSFPTLFDPVEIDGRYYTDGGVTNNYPIDEVKAKGMDIIIGVDVQDSLLTIKDMDSAFKILYQISKFSMEKAMKGKPEKTDIYIQPVLKGYGVISFDKGRTIIKRGEEATKKFLPSLREIAKHQKNKIPRKPIQNNDTILIKGIEFFGNENYSRSYLLGKLGLADQHKISFKALGEGVTNLVATNNFSSVNYKIKTDKNRENRLLISVREKSNKAFLKFGIHYDNLYKTGFLVNLTKQNLFQEDDIASLDVILGDNLRYKFDYFVDKGFYISYGLSSKYSQFGYGIPSKLVENLLETPIRHVNKIDINFYDWTNQLYFQTISTNNFVVGAGLEHKNLKINTETISSSIGKKSYFEDSHFLSAYGYLITDTFDHKFYPTKGLFLKADAHFYFANKGIYNNFSKFTMVQAVHGFAFSLSDKWSISSYFSGGFKIGTNDVRSLDFLFGGYGNNFINNYKSFLGYDYLSFGANSFLKAEFKLDYQFIKNHHFLIEGNFANVDDNLYGTGNWLQLPKYRGYGIGYGWNSFIGPIELRGTWSPEINKAGINFNLGFWF